MAGHGTPGHIDVVNPGVIVSMSLRFKRSPTFPRRSLPYIPCGTRMVGRFGSVRMETRMTGSLA